MIISKPVEAIRKFIERNTAASSDGDRYFQCRISALLRLEIALMQKSQKLCVGHWSDIGPSPNVEVSWTLSEDRTRRDYSAVIFRAKGPSAANGESIGKDDRKANDFLSAVDLQLQRIDDDPEGGPAMESGQMVTDIKSTPPRNTSSPTDIAAGPSPDQ